MKAQSRKLGKVAVLLSVLFIATMVLVLCQTANQAAAQDDVKIEAEKKAPAEDESGESEKDREDEREGAVAAMDAASVQAVVAAAVKAERERARAVEAAKRDTRHVLGDTIAMDSAGDIYRAALEQSGVDVSAIAAGAEQIAWQAYNVGSRSAVRGPVVANDSRTAGKPLFNTDHIKRR